MENRKRIRAGVQVIHRHRIGRRAFRRVSELVFVQGEPRLVLGWIDLAGVRAPIYLKLDRRRLRRAGTLKNRYYYDEVTSDPRFEDMQPLPDGEKRA
ncbi:MAG TPA: hypothetical protein VFB08_04750 [Burkholderiales bacterium]|nr:hypothetical protein [Burkholderiales bacterium]